MTQVFLSVLETLPQKFPRQQPSDVPSIPVCSDEANLMRTYHQPQVFLGHGPYLTLCLPPSA